VLYHQRGTWILAAASKPGLLGGIGRPVMPLVIRHRRKQEQEPKPESPVRYDRRPWPLRVRSASGILTRSEPPRDLGRRMGRWKRVTYWWLFDPAELESILARPWRAPEVES
jgi:hypothetical protein